MLRIIIRYLPSIRFLSSFLRGPQMSQHTGWMAPPPDPEVGLSWFSAVSLILAVSWFRSGNVAPTRRSPGVL